MRSLELMKLYADLVDFILEICLCFFIFWSTFVSGLYSCEICNNMFLCDR